MPPFTTVSIQSSVPNGRRSALQLLEAAVQSQPELVVLPPLLLTANGQALEARTGSAFRILQNCGTVPVKFLVDPENSPTADTFHGILAACSAVDDGLGSIVNFSQIPRRVSILGVGGNPRVCVWEACLPKDI